jgi:hypothetical protein
MDREEGAVIREELLHASLVLAVIHNTFPERHKAYLAIMKDIAFVQA